MRKWEINITECFYFIICIVLSSWYFLPVVKETIAPIYIALLGMVVLGILFFNKKIVATEVLLFFFVLFVIFIEYFFFTYYSNLDKAIGIVTQLFISTLPAIIFCFIKQKENLLKPFWIIISIFVAFVLIKTFFEMIANPDIARILAHGDKKDESLREYRLQNLGGFGHSYGVAFLSGVFLKRFTDKNATHRILYFALFVLSVIYVFNTQYFLALFVIGFLVISCLYIKSTGEKKFLCILGGFLLLFLLPTIFNFFSQITDGTISDKFQEIADSITTGTIMGSSSTARMDVYVLSLKQFITSPFIGTAGSYTAYSVVGGHSTFLDFMALNGMVGAAVYILVLRFTKNVIHIHDSFYKGIFSAYIILSVLNPTMNMYELSGFVFLYIPLFFTLTVKPENQMIQREALL